MKPIRKVVLIWDEPAPAFGVQRGQRWAHYPLRGTALAILRRMKQEATANEGEIDTTALGAVLDRLQEEPADAENVTPGEVAEAIAWFREWTAQREAK